MIIENTREEDLIDLGAVTQETKGQPQGSAPDGSSTANNKFQPPALSAD